MVKSEYKTNGGVCWCLWYVIKYLYLSELGAFLLIHFRHLGFNIRVISDGVKVTLIVF